MRGSMVMTDALEVVAVIGEFLPGIFGLVMQLCRSIPIYWALLSEERPLAGSLIYPTLQIRSGQECNVFTDKLRSRLLHLDVSPRLHTFITLRSHPECHAKKPAMFIATVNQKTATKLGLEHL